MEPLKRMNNQFGYEIWVFFCARFQLIFQFFGMENVKMRFQIMIAYKIRPQTDT